MNDVDEIYQRVSEACAQRSCQATEHCLCVLIGEQKLYHFQATKLVKAYLVSTSKKPPSCIENSFGTPTGLHKVADKIGAGAPPGMVFKARVPIGWTWDKAPPIEDLSKNLITSRILRLRGLEDGHNAGPGCDSYDRYIYIHGTNHPEKIGTPASSGCVQLSDSEVIELFAAVPENSLVWIEQ